LQEDKKLNAKKFNKKICHEKMLNKEKNTQKYENAKLICILKLQNSLKEIKNDD
jgi:hypothetical protein